MGLDGTFSLFYYTVISSLQDQPVMKTCDHQSPVMGIINLSDNVFLSLLFCVGSLSYRCISTRFGLLRPVPCCALSFPQWVSAVRIRLRFSAGLAFLKFCNHVAVTSTVSS